ncbi:hypothetical protein [[Clostridium] scindens]|uniref:hypothetical protein n=1 Tax=Clostridium scindens (strain JCM 10418 / VPI 12708) TaxID=29347 RepID=UPI0039F5242A
MEADIKMQIEAIKNPSKVRVMDYGEVVLLVDGHKGPYIKKEMAMIDLSKVKKVKENEELDPNNTKITKIKRTNHLLICKSGSIACRFDTDEGEHIWARNDWIKEYRNAMSYVTIENKTAVIPIGITGEPLGVVLCMRINDET